MPVTMENVQKLAGILLNDTDWEALREQKLSLLKIIKDAEWEYKNAPHNDIREQCAKQHENLKGLLHFLDSIQDKCAEILGEETIFGKDSKHE